MNQFLYRPCVYCADTKEVNDNRKYNAIVTKPPISDEKEANKLLFDIIPEALEKVKQIYSDIELEVAKVGNCFYIKEKNSIIGFIAYGCVNFLYYTKEADKWIYGNFSIYEYEYNLFARDCKNMTVANQPIVNYDTEKAFNSILDHIDNLYHNQNYDSDIEPYNAPNTTNHIDDKFIDNDSIFVYNTDTYGCVMAIRIYLVHGHIPMAELVFPDGRYTTIEWANVSHRDKYKSGINAYTLIYDERPKKDFKEWIL